MSLPLVLVAAVTVGVVRLRPTAAPAHAGGCKPSILQELIYAGRQLAPSDPHALPRMSRLPAGWKLLYRGTGANFCDAQVIGTLEVNPKLCRHFKPVRQSECRVTGNGSLALNDLRDPIGWNANLAR